LEILGILISTCESKIVGEIFGAQIEICETNEQIKIFDVQKIKFISDDKCYDKKFFQTDDINTSFIVECENNGKWKCRSPNNIEIWNTIIKCSNLSIQSCHFVSNVQKLNDSTIAIIVLIILVSIVIYISYKIDR
jgi:hypothetical protein